MTAVCYVNHMGGTVSRKLVSLTKNLWSWCMERNIMLQAQHLPGRLNVVANKECRTLTDRSDWSLDCAVFEQLDALWGSLRVDLFASRLTKQCPVFFSWRPDPLAVAMDAFLQQWRSLAAYVNPPWNLVGRTLMTVMHQAVKVVLVAPVWTARPWFPTLLEMVIEEPRMLPQRQAMSHSSLETPSLAAWLISGEAVLSKDFRRKLLYWLNAHGENAPTEHTIPLQCVG